MPAGGDSVTNLSTLGLGICAIGTSITIGTGGTSGVDGYRPSANMSIMGRICCGGDIPRPCRIIYKGTLNGGAQLPWRNHRGFGSSTILNHINGTGTVSGSLVATYGSGLLVDTGTIAIRCELGANEVSDTSHFVTDYENLLTGLHSALPLAVFSLARCTHNEANQAAIDTMNGLLPTIVSDMTAAGLHVVLEADAGLIYPTDFNLASAPHPNDAGYAKLGPVAADGIVAALRLGGYLS